MNNKAKAIGMKNTHFVNPTGAENSRLRTFAPTKYKDQERTVTTARDYAILDLHVIKETPKILDFTKQLAPTTHAVTYYTFNFSLEGAKMSLPGTDGLKTGSVIQQITTIRLLLNEVNLELIKLSWVRETIKTLVARSNVI